MLIYQYAIANATNSYYDCVNFTIGVGEVHCGLYPVTFVAGSANASVTVPILNDEIAECDETFTVNITTGEGGRRGFRPGPLFSALLTVMDDDSKYYIIVALCCICILIVIVCFY